MATCQDKNIFSHITHEDEIAMFKNKHSVELGYLQGDNTANKYCHSKVQSDIIHLDIIVETNNIIQTNTRKSSYFGDQLGLIGNLK